MGLSGRWCALQAATLETEPYPYSKVCDALRTIRLMSRGQT